jgi:glycosyltransferase involved in cell wall biosynthesis
MTAALDAADGVVANVPGARAAFERIAPRTGRVPYAVVTNGWEESDFPAPVDVPKGDTWRLRVAGNFLSTDFQRFSPAKRAWRLLRVAGEPIDGRGRSPYFLLGALASLRDDAHPAGRDAVLEIAGNVDPLTRRVIDDSGFADRVRMPGFLPHDRCTEFAATADALVLAMHGLPAGARARMVPGKFYEYLAAGRPILGLAPEGDARDWLREDPRSRVAEPCSAASIREALVAMHDAWRRGEAVASRRIPLATRFTRRAQAEELHRYLGEVVARKR